VVAAPTEPVADAPELELEKAANDSELEKATNDGTDVANASMESDSTPLFADLPSINMSQMLEAASAVEPVKAVSDTVPEATSEDIVSDAPTDLAADAPAEPVADLEPLEPKRVQDMSKEELSRFLDGDMGDYVPKAAIDSELEKAANDSADVANASTESDSTPLFADVASINMSQMPEAASAVEPVKAVSDIVPEATSEDVVSDAPTDPADAAPTEPVAAAPSEANSYAVDSQPPN